MTATNWALNWTAVAAIASGLAATATVYLGYQTLKMAKATRAGAESTKDLAETSAAQLQQIRTENQQQDIENAHKVQTYVASGWEEDQFGITFTGTVFNGSGGVIFDCTVFLTSYLSIRCDVGRIGLDGSSTLRFKGSREAMEPPPKEQATAFITQFRDAQGRWWSTTESGQTTFGKLMN